MLEIFHDFSFEAALSLPGLPGDHPCGRTHGHSFHVEIALRGPLDPTIGWVQDFGDVQAACDPLIAMLDHSLLNEIEGLEHPTSENVACWLFDRLEGPLPQLWSVAIRDTPRTGVRLTREMRTAHEQPTTHKRPAT